MLRVKIDTNIEFIKVFFTMSSTTLKELIEQFNNIKEGLEKEVEIKRSAFNYQLNKRKVSFELVLHQTHKKLKTGVLSYILNANPLFVITAPIIYIMIIPLLLLDLFAFLYQFICFPLYKMQKIKRSDYVVIDRHKLGYLNFFEKFNCVYCGYANGLLSYVGELASITEQYWCPIKHARMVKNPHDRYWSFIDYADADAYVCDLKTHRNKAKIR